MPKMKWTAGALALFLATPSFSAPNGVLISEFRARGPAGGNDEFVELYNTGSSAVDISGWKLNGCSSGTPGSESTRATIPNGVSLLAGQHYLFTNSGSSGYSGSVAGDQTYSTGFTDFQSSNYAGIALRDASSTLQDGVGSPLSPCREGTGITTSTTNPTSQVSRARLSSETQDTADNSADFAAEAAATPTARGSAPACTNDGIAISAIQGAAQLSPYRGLCVINVAGVVTQLGSNGFYMQNPTGDGDEATSDGIFVFTSSTPSASIVVGSEVKVDGMVDEYRPGSSFSATNCASSSGACNLTITELTSPTVTLSPGLFGSTDISPVVLGSAGRLPPSEIIDNDTSGSVEVTAQTTYDPTEDGIDFYESLEGMQVRLDNAVVTGPINQYGEIWVVGDNAANASGVNARGGVTLVDRAGVIDFNPERTLIDISDLVGSDSYPQLHVGAMVASISGALSYNFGDFVVFPSSLPSFDTSAITREPTTISMGGDRLSIASYNVENLDPNDADSCNGKADADVADGRFSSEAAQIVDLLKAPDILALEEIQDNTGCTDDGTVDASLTLQTLIDAIVAAGGPSYAYTTVSPTDGTDGGAPGANIRQAFLYNAARVSLVPGSLGAGSALDATSVALNGDGKLELSLSPGRVDPTNTAFDDSRKPLAAMFEFHGERVLTVVNHFNSKGGDYPLFGRYQPPVLTSEAQRIEQAQVLHDFLAGALVLKGDARIVALGDFNDFEWSSPLQVLTGASAGTVILHDLGTVLLPEEERYSYVFEGNSQELDHIYVSESLLPEADFEPLHINAEFSDQLSDHDPIIASLRPAPADNTPDAFDFPDRPHAPAARPVPSAAVVLSGFDAGTAVSIEGGEYRVNGGAWTTEPGSLAPGDSLQLRVQSAARPGASVTATVTVGTVSDAYRVSTTRAAR